MSELQMLHPGQRATAVTTGLITGAVSTLLALSLVFAGVVPTFGLVIGALAALYLLTSLEAALIVVLATAAILPFGTFPVKIAFTPSLIDCALGGFLTVYLFQWMTGRRRSLEMAPPAWNIILFLGVIIFSFILGTGYARPTPNQLKAFAELCLSISMALILADVTRNYQTLRRVALILVFTGTAAAVLGILLWLLPDITAESILNRLGRLGYPVGGVIRYRQDNASVLNERAIGTWVDPNTFGGFLLMIGGLAGAQLFSRVPVTRWRWLSFACFAAIGTALFLTDSRGSFVGLAAGLGLLALLYHRRLLWVMVTVAVLLLLLPQTQMFVNRMIAGFQAADLETQMRLGEYKDALLLIQRYPVFGIGFTGTPDIDLYVGFSSTYLMLAAYTGFVGVGAYLLVFGSALGWGLSRWQYIKQDSLILDIWLGLLAGIVGALVSGIVDHFYFSPQYQATGVILWTFVGLFLAATRLGSRTSSIQKAKSPQVH